MKAGRAVLDFGAHPGASDASIAVADTEIKSGAKIFLQMARRATVDHGADDAGVSSIELTAGDIVEGTGFTIYGRALAAAPQSDSATSGPRASGGWAVDWMWAI
jgi:hypothetical protein